MGGLDALRAINNILREMAGVRTADHIGGVRSFIAEGTPIVTTPDAKSVIERAAAVHSMRPDALSCSPRAPVIETLKDKRVFDDGAHRVEFYEF